jgi:hypothetical protein
MVRKTRTRGRWAIQLLRNAPVLLADTRAACGPLFARSDSAVAAYQLVTGGRHAARGMVGLTERRD